MKLCYIPQNCPISIAFHLTQYGKTLTLLVYENVLQGIFVKEVLTARGNKGGGKYIV